MLMRGFGNLLLLMLFRTFELAIIGQRSCQGVVFEQFVDELFLVV